MERTLRNMAFWSFQVINTITACLMTFIPKQFHESLFKNPEAVYKALGFSAIAVEMVHNIIRGQGAVLLAVSLFSWIEGKKSRSVYLLISIICTLSVYAQIMTLHQHLKTAEIVNAIGNFGSMYVIIIVTAVVGILSLVVYLKWGKSALYVEKKR
ncbi:MAG: hypothetical protein K9K75_02100 [Deltaproteobacteria bacterium]|nr:hypothetical protein [Deltaproteobacteria bacterium]